MPRKIELTWQPGANSRQGRWKKRYKGKVYYFSASNKSDIEAYRAAVDAWLRKKKEIDDADSSRPKQHQAAYTAAIDQWELARQWARENGDAAMVALADTKISFLNNQFKLPVPPPLEHFDYLLNQRTIHPDVLAKVAHAVDSAAFRMRNDELLLNNTPAFGSLADCEATRQLGPATATITETRLMADGSSVSAILTSALSRASITADSPVAPAALAFGTNGEPLLGNVARGAEFSVPRSDASFVRLLGGGAPPDSMANRQTDLAIPTNNMRALEVEVLPQHIDELDGSPERKFRELWLDRLAAEGRKRGASAETVATTIQAFLAMKRLRVDSGELSAGRCANLRGYLETFCIWLGPNAVPASITGKALSDYHAEQLSGVATGKCSPDYARDRLGAVKEFVRWLYRTERIDQLPRNLHSSDLRIARRIKAPNVFTIVEVQTLLLAACPRTKLYLLLMLNCGMTQKDISDLRQDQVDWDRGVIVRKRSKTAKHEGVPTVRYQLWPETFRLLKCYRGSDPDVVLLNATGDRLKTETFGGNDKLRKTDKNIISAYRRVAAKVKIKKSPKVFRKTSSSLVDNNPRYRGLGDLFLGLAPDTISEKHYIQAPQDLLDEAVAWLGKQYDIE